MPKETKEEKLARMEELRKTYEEDLAVYKANVPKRLMQLQALATSVGVRSSVDLTISGPVLKLRNEEKPFIGCDLTYDVEEWELECAERDVQNIKTEQDERAARRIVANGAWDTLTPEVKAAIKENIHYLR